MTPPPPETSSTTTTSYGGGEGGDSHKSERSFLYFSSSELSCHMCHVSTKRAEATEGLIELLYDRVDGIFSRSDLERILILLGGDAGRGREGVGG